MAVGASGVSGLFWTTPITPGNQTAWLVPGVLEDGGVPIGGVSIGGLVVGGTPGSVLFIDNSGDLGQDPTEFSWDDVNHILTIGDNLPLTASSPSIEIQQIWNNAAAVFEAITLNVTNTASNSSSKLIDLMVGGTTSFGVNVAGDVQVGSGVVNSLATTFKVSIGGTGIMDFGITNAGVMTVFGTANITQIIQSNNTQGTAFSLHNTTPGAHGFQFFTTGSGNGPGHFGVFDEAAGATWFDINGGHAGDMKVAENAVFGWDSDPAGFGSIVTGLGQNAAGLVEINNGTLGTLRDLTLRDIFTNDASFAFRTKTTLSNAAAANAATLANAPAAGNPTKWFSIDDNGTTRRIPAW